VRDSAGQLANSLHLLSLPCPLVSSAPFREVAGYLGEA
jgi:hypothetical protein